MLIDGCPAMSWPANVGAVLSIMFGVHLCRHGSLVLGKVGAVLLFGSLLGLVVSECVICVSLVLFLLVFVRFSPKNKTPFLLIN
jgi:hypothetical protein